MIVNYTEVESIVQLNRLIADRRVVTHCAFQDIDFNQADPIIDQCHFQDCLFLGCHFPNDFYIRTTEDCIIFEELDVPYNAFRSKLYDGRSLYAGYDVNNPDSYKDCFDGIVYQHYLDFGKQTKNIKESLARSIHDNSISGALHAFLDRFNPWQIVGLMGGHGMARTDIQYKQVSILAKTLTETGSVMVSGGGPGAMEATHLGAWMAGRTMAELNEALDILSVAPTFRDPGWLSSAFEVMEQFPQNTYESLGVPTWLYGHEPSTPFATQIAKYFDNSIREDGILTIALGGVVYTPGSAGTLQEIFQEAVQDHYLSFGYASPMIFLGTDFWTKEMPVYPLIQQLVKTGKYKNLLLSLSDSPKDVLEELSYFRSQMKDITPN